MKQKKTVYMVPILLALLFGARSAQSQQVGANSTKPNSSTNLQFILSRYAKTETIETISYDEEKQVFTGLPQDVDATKLHYLDIPYAVTTKQTQHTDEVLTSGGEYIKVVTYKGKEDLGDKWPNEARYRVFLPGKVLALNSNKEVIAETPNSGQYYKIHHDKGINALRNGLFEWHEFEKINPSIVENAKKEGFEVKIIESEYRFIKNGITLLIYDAEHLYTGQSVKEGDKEVERINYFKRNEQGYIIPSHHRVSYPDQLPTGVKVMKSELTVVTNFVLDGKRYIQTTSQGTDNSSALKITPNPAKDILYCQLLLPQIPLQAKVFYQVEDVNGRILLAVQKLKGDNVNGINISQLPAGVYLLRVTTGNKVMQQKFVKTNN